MKTLVWIIGKPGSGKSTIGHSLASLNGIAHLSYGELLKETRPNPSDLGYSMEDRRKVNQIILAKSQNYSVTVVDGNPYSKLGFGFVNQMEKAFNKIHIILLSLADNEALVRLNQRNREVLIHDGATQKDRLKNFNKNVQPLIDGYRKNHLIIEIDVTKMTLDEIRKKVVEVIGDF